MKIRKINVELGYQDRTESHVIHLEITGEANREVTERLENKARSLFLRAIQAMKVSSIGKHNIKIGSDTWAIELENRAGLWAGKAFRFTKKAQRVRNRVRAEQSKEAQYKYFYRHDLNRKSLKY